MGVRVIAGQHRGRILRTPAGRSTRPTGSRAREAIFSILGSCDGETVLDLYAGSGAFAIEALSRGALRAAFVESDSRALACIRQNLEELRLRGVSHVLPSRVERAAAALEALVPTTGQFSLVFCDPPWADVAEAAQAVEKLTRVLSDEARLVFEHPAAVSIQIEGLHEFDRRQWGDTGMTLFRKATTTDD